MTSTIQGWVIVNPNVKDQVYWSTFRATKQRCINDFVKLFVSTSWKFMWRKYGYRCVRATQTITTE